MLSIHDLLNPVTPARDAPRPSGVIHAETPSPPRAVPTPSDLGPRPLGSTLSLGGVSTSRYRRALVEQSVALSESQNTSPRHVLPALTAEDGLLSTTHNVRVGPRSKLQTMYHYSRSVALEYPETSDTGKVGHLFDVSPEDFHNPRLSFAYSQGSPSGRTTAGKPVYCEALRDDDGEPVPCQESHYTCESRF